MHMNVEGKRNRDDAPPTAPPEAPPNMCSFYVKRSDMAMHRYTRGWKGCNAIRVELPPQRHSDACRTHVIELPRSQPRRRTRI